MNLVKTFLKIGTFGFGGGIGMLAILRSECVKRKGWISDDELSVGVALGQMVPGPFVPHYCQYIGQHLGGLKGAILAPAAMLFPSFLLMIVLSYLYLAFKTLPGIELAFKGIGAVMTAVIIWAGYDMGKVLIREFKGVLVFCSAMLLFFMRIDPVLIVIMCGGLKILLDHVRSMKVLLAVPLFAFNLKKAAILSWIFLKIGAVIFGGGYAAVPFIQNEVCNYRSWLTAREFLDGVALGQLTPGPVAITATFVGFKVLGIPGALIATVAIFLPSFLMLMLFMKVYKRVEHNRYVISFFGGTKAAVVAILFYTGIVFVTMNWLSIPYAVLGVGCLAALMFLRIEPFFLVLAGIIFSFIAR